MEKEKYYHAYEKRYTAVYGAGARYWNPHEPSRALRRFLDAYRITPCPALELGCGEGFESRFLARRNFPVTAVDLSPTVIAKCQKEADEERLPIRCVLGDITRLPGVEDGAFDMVVAIGSYHMLNHPEDRARCMSQMFRALAKGGWMFMQNGLDLREAERYFPEDREEIKAFRTVRLGKTVTRSLSGAEGHVEVTVPVTPKTYFAPLEEFERETIEAGFSVVEAYRTNEDKINAGWEAVIIARK